MLYLYTNILILFTSGDVILPTVILSFYIICGHSGYLPICLEHFEPCSFLCTIANINYLNKNPRMAVCRYNHKIKAKTNEIL